MPRQLAYDLLRSTSPTPLRDLEREADRRGIEGRDRALARRIVATCLRRRGTLLALVQTFVRGKPKPELATLLHIGIAQLLFLDRVPDHAAVNTTVDAANDTLGLSKGRIVNGTLRNLIRARIEGTTDDPHRQIVGANWYFDVPVFRSQDLHPLLWAEDALSMPAPILKGWSERHGWERALELARFALDEPPLSVHVLADDVDGAVAALEAALVEHELAPLAREGRNLVLPTEATEHVVALDAFARGELTIQGAAATRAAELVGARPGERVLDLCAAPGGKTALLARAGAEVTAVDVDARRLARVEETAARLGVAERVRCVVSDGTAELEDGLFDAVLVDAPCSNSGVFAARPEARWRFGPASRASLGELQQRLAREGAERVAPGGRLVWSTCSLEPGENTAIVNGLVRDRDDFELEEQHLSLPAGNEVPVDGGFAARLVRRI
ncbi:Ribosomal RNA small subunit methyltransferase B [Planctomycetes bacterium Pla163]|uniref:Ribosomal RNA small subunit methyltransferase B n=1 Tax=Rohdeia mirabilis TaxID=2528008 RepID=A0A518CUN7_9BACT|nr:Ribosomal RNA small subunit methyltransferase B [Planctomycetes bacterium Pla163]